MTPQQAQRSGRGTSSNGVLAFGPGSGAIKALELVGLLPPGRSLLLLGFNGGDGFGDRGHAARFGFFRPRFSIEADANAAEYRKGYRIVRRRAAMQEGERIVFLR